MMLPRDGILCTMEIKLIYFVLLGLFLGLCLANVSNPDNPSTCRGYCEIFSDICKNGGTCVEPSPCSNTGRCKCPPNYEGEHCQKLINPDEGKSSQSANKKPRRKHRNLLLLSLFKSLALPRSDSKFTNNIGDEIPTKTYKDEVGKSNQKPDTNVAKTTPSTTVTTTTSTTTLPSTTTTASTTTSITTTAETTTAKTTTTDASEAPVTSTENSDEVTTSAGDIPASTAESYSVFSEEQTTEGKANEYQTTTEFANDLLVMQNTSESGSNVDTNKKNSPSVAVPAHTTPSIIQIPDQNRNTEATDSKFITHVTGNAKSKTDQSNPTFLPSLSSSTKSLSTKKEEEQMILETNIPSKSETIESLVKKTVSHTTLGSLLFPKIVGIPSVRSGSMPDLPPINNKKENTNSEKFGNILTVENEPQLLGTTMQDLSQNKLSSTVESQGSTTASPVLSNTELKQNSDKILSSPLPETKIVDNKIAFRELVGGKPQVPGRKDPLSSTTVPETSNLPVSTQQSKSIMNNVVKVVEKALDKSKVSLINTLPSEKADSDFKRNSTSGTAEPPQSENKLYDKITTLTNRLTKEFASSLKKIIKSVFTEPESSNAMTPGKDSNFDVIIPDNVNDLKQLDQHMHKIKPVDEKDKHIPTSSHAPDKIADTPGINPTVAGEKLPDSQTTADYTASTSAVQ